MQIIKPILSGLAIVMVIVGGAVGAMVNIILGTTLIVLAMLFVIASGIIGLSAKIDELRQPITVPQFTPKAQPQQPQIISKSEPQIVSSPTEIAPEATEMPITIEKPEEPVKVSKEQKAALEAKQLAEEAIAEAEKKMAEEPEKPEEFKPEPQPTTFKCKKCEAKGIEKQFPNEKRLKRHIGMAHYADLEI